MYNNKENLMAYNNRPQYNKVSYQKQSYTSNNNNGSGGTAKIISTKKDGCILVVELENQNLVRKGYWDNRSNGWKLFPYYDKTKKNPQFNQPRQPNHNNDMDDQLPQSEKAWLQKPNTDFDPDQYESELGESTYE